MVKIGTALELKYGAALNSDFQAGQILVLYSRKRFFCDEEIQNPLFCVYLGARRLRA